MVQVYFHGRIHVIVALKDRHGTYFFATNSHSYKFTLSHCSCRCYPRLPHYSLYPTIIILPPLHSRHCQDPKSAPAPTNDGNISGKRTLGRWTARLIKQVIPWVELAARRGGILPHAVPSRTQLLYGKR